MAQDKARPTRARTKKDVVVESDAAAKPRVRRKSVKRGPGEVATLAYFLWERGEPGDAMEHWLRAEREIAA